MSETKTPVMTPEERARAIYASFGVSAQLRDAIEAAIREAVKAERAACLKAAEAVRRDSSTGGAYAVWNRACDRIAAAIRARTL